MFVPFENCPEISVKRTFNEENGTVYVRYFYKRKPIPAVLLDSKLSEQLAGYSMIQKDLKTVYNWLESIHNLVPNLSEAKGNFLQAKDRETFNIVKGLFVSSLTFYAKCFTNCPGRRSRLNRNTLSEEYRSAHDEIMLYRNSFAAHSGKEQLEMAKSILIINTKKDYEIRISQERAQPDYIHPQGEISFKRLITHLLEKVSEKQDKVERKLLDEILLNKDDFRKYCKSTQGIFVQLNNGF
ncbi:hypothetical protein [Shewanella chilikensis]|uniref:hypothetical protein n=1 Tax=Shewanella chilikensis TaxID=558541 RepID=UPI003B6853BC